MHPLRPLLPLLLSLFLSLLCPLAVAGPAADALGDFFDQVKGLRAEFAQELFDRQSGEIQRSNGVVMIQRPGRFRWDYREPFEQQIVADGKNLWFYDPELEQVTLKPLAEGLEGTPALLLSEERPLAERFTIVELPVEGKLLRVELTPKAKETNFEKIRLGFAAGGGELALMEIVDSFGQVTRLRFTGVERNPALPPALFRFLPPPGVDVIGEGN